MRYTEKEIQNLTSKYIEDVSAYADPKINAFEMGLSLDFDIMKKELENETKE